MSREQSPVSGAFVPPWQAVGLPPSTPVLLGLSGGADSTALLHLLVKCAERDGFSILAAHVNHGIRGAEADRDEAFCRALAESCGCSFALRRADVPALAAERGKSLEETAREVRYAFFEELMREKQIALLVTAHHADDNLETILFRLCRGTGLRGLCGIPPVRAFAGGYLVRPLLPFSEREILAYCEEARLTFVRDSTNADPAYTRNRIRVEVVPMLETVVAEPQKSVYRMTQTLAQDQDCLEGMARDFLAAHRSERGISVEALRMVHPAIRKRALAAVLPSAPEAVHLEALEQLIRNDKSGSACSLPGRMLACVQNGRLMILPDLRCVSLSQSIPFGEGSVALCDGMLTVCVKKIENCDDTINVHNLSTDACIIINGISDIMLKDACWRTRREGDTLTVRGIKRRLGKLYRESGIPPMLRDFLPLLCYGEEILWAPFVGVRDGIGTSVGGNPPFYRLELRFDGAGRKNERTTEDERYQRRH